MYMCKYSVFPHVHCNVCLFLEWVRAIKHTLVILQFISAAENEYQVFLVKKEATKKSYQEAQLELNVLIAETESHNHKLAELVEQEKQTNELVESLPVY